MRRPRPRDDRRRRAGFSLLEVQVAFVVLGIALAGIGPLVVMQLRLTKKIEARLDPKAVHYLIPPGGDFRLDTTSTPPQVVGFASSSGREEAWARKLGAAASVRGAGSLSGAVFVDLNADGVRQNGEPGIAGVSVTFTGTNDLGDSIRLVAVTGANGSYFVTDLRPGTYALAEAQPSGYLDGQDAAGSLGGAVGDDLVSGIPLTTGAVGTGYNFGEVATTVSGAVFLDSDGDGAYQPSEGIAGISVVLTGTDANGNGVAMTATTTGDGSYAFKALPPSNPSGYTIVEIPAPAGMTNNRGNARGNAPLSGIVVTAGANLSGYNFAHATLTSGALFGVVFADSNGDGVKQAGETGIAGVALTLSGVDSSNRNVQATTVTGADGSYGFLGLTPSGPSGYAISEAPPNGYLDGQDAAGSLGGTAGNDLIAGIPVAAGTLGAGYNFGQLQYHVSIQSITRAINSEEMTAHVSVATAAP
jgi:hypothetical protein